MASSCLCALPTSYYGCCVCQYRSPVLPMPDLWLYLLRMAAAWSYCLGKTMHCLLPAACLRRNLASATICWYWSYRGQPLSGTIFKCLPTNLCLLPPAFHPLAYYLCLLTPAYELLPSTLCLLPAYCLLPTPCYPPHSANYQRHATGLPKPTQAPTEGSGMRACP